MIDFLYYLLKVSGVFIALYLVYRLFFSGLTFHNVNRVFLLAILPLSIIVPYIDIELFPNSPLVQTTIPEFLDEFGYVGEQAQTAVNTSIAWNWTQVLGMLYGLGLLIYLVKLSINALKLVRIKRQSSSVEDDGFSIIGAEVPTVFSCFKWIFVPNAEQQSIESSVIEHEKLHGKSGHTLDLIATELYAALLWFNPFVYLFLRDLKSVHEFQVDSRLLQSNLKTSDYLQLILNKLNSKHRTVGLYNYFNGLTIKKRVTMITKNKSSRWQSIRYFLIVPVIAVMMMSFSNVPIAGDIVPEGLIAEIPVVGGGDVPSISPIKKGDYKKISSHYGMRVHPIKKVKKMHTGIDFAAEKGTDVIATADGIVTAIKFLEKGYGKMVVISHGNQYETWYTQLSDYAVKQGDKVKQGDLIGYVGSSGMSLGPHLHYEVRINGKPVNPAEYMKE